MFEPGKRVTHRGTNKAGTILTVRPKQITVGEFAVDAVEVLWDDGGRELVLPDLLQTSFGDLETP